MKHTILKIDFMPFFYVLLADLPNSPLVNKGVIKLASDISDKGTISFPHQFDKDLVPVFKGFVYLLNLPRTTIDLFYFGNESKITIVRGTDWHSHAIYVIPIQNMDSVFFKPTLVVAPDNIFHKTDEFCIKFECTLPPVSVSQLNQELVHTHWKKLWNIHRRDMGGLSSIIHHPAFEIDSLPIELPINYKYRQPTVIKFSNAEEISSVFPEGYSFSVVVPGVSSNYKKDLMRVGFKETFSQSVASTKFEDLDRVESDASIENIVFSLLSTHSALRDLGVGGVFSAVPQNMFDELNKLEVQISQRNPKASKVWAAIRSIGRNGSDLLNQTQKDILNAASSLKVFSNFPLGLITLDNNRDPLQLKCPISYLPLSGLTHTLCNELRACPNITLKRLRILFTELTDSNDPVGQASRKTTQRIMDKLRDNSIIQMESMDINDIHELRILLKRMKFDILVISAHGGVDKTTNIAGILCKDKFITARELEAVPGIVILNSCTTSPKSRGSLGIIDELLNIGADSVVGTLMPINVYRNSYLIERLFESIANLIRNKISSTFLEIWWNNIVVCSIYDVIYSNSKLKKWMSTNYLQGQTLFEEFGRRLESNFPRYGNFYGDTLNILSGLAQETGFKQDFDRIAEMEFIIPEALFYALYGWPENISV